MVFGAIMGAMKKAGGAMAKANKGTKRSGIGTSAYKDFTDGNPLHYEKHMKPTKTKSKKNTKGSCHHKR